MSEKIYKCSATGRYQSLEPILYDDYSEEALPSNTTRMMARRYGCNLPNESRDSWEELSSVVTYMTIAELENN